MTCTRLISPAAQQGRRTWEKLFAIVSVTVKSQPEICVLPALRHCWPNGSGGGGAEEILSPFFFVHRHYGYDLLSLCVMKGCRQTSICATQQFFPPDVEGWKCGFEAIFTAQFFIHRLAGVILHPPRPLQQTTKSFVILLVYISSGTMVWEILSICSILVRKGHPFCSTAFQALLSAPVENCVTHRLNWRSTFTQSSCEIRFKYDFVKTFFTKSPRVGFDESFELIGQNQHRN